MTDKIILNIRHSDDYTDYLLMTAGLTNKRIVPLVNPSSEKLKAARDNNTKVLSCNVVRRVADAWSSPVSGYLVSGLSFTPGNPDLEFPALLSHRKGHR